MLWYWQPPGNQFHQSRERRKLQNESKVELCGLKKLSSETLMPFFLENEDPYFNYKFFPLINLDIIEYTGYSIAEKN